MSADWPLKRLSEVADFLNHKRVPLKSLDRDKRQGNFPYYGASGIVDSIDDYIFDGNYLLISEDGENLRTRNTPIAFQANGKFWVNNHAHILQEKEEGILDYLEYYFSNLDLTPYITGAVQPKLNKRNLDSIEVPIPPKHSRLAINQVLNSFTDKIELNRQTNQTLEQIAQAIFKSWFVDFEPTRAKIIAQDMGADTATQELAAQAIICGALTLEQLADIEQNLATTLQEAIHTKLSHNSPTPINAEQLATTAALFPNALVESELGEIPEGWAVKPFSDWVTVTKGKSITRAKAVPGDIPVVAGGREPAYYHNEFNVEGPAITISASGANAGYVNLYRQNIWSSDSSYINKQTTPYFYTAYTFLKYRQKAIFDMQTGAAQPHIYPRDFERLYVVVANDSLLSIFEKQLVSYFECSFSLEEESITLAELRDTLLPKLLSGELDVSALADDSAPAIKTKEAFDV